VFSRLISIVRKKLEFFALFETLSFPMAQPPPNVLDLIQRFDRNHDAYCSPHYNETQLRREFLDPLFKSLGWDVDNEQGYAEPYKDVVHEDAIKVGEATKAPDYSFRIGGTRRFFLEAKRPTPTPLIRRYPAAERRLGAPGHPCRSPNRPARLRPSRSDAGGDKDFGRSAIKWCCFPFAQLNEISNSLKHL
jgi:hypothetical protein